MREKLGEVFVSLIFIIWGTSAHVSEDSICASLFSDVGFTGNSFLLLDEDQSVDMKRDYRSSMDGWGNMSYIRVKENCTLTACSGTYFEGTCISYPSGHQSDMLGIGIQSASCTCVKECKCEDILHIKNDEVCGRAYVTGNCNECYSQYFDLWRNKLSWHFPSEYVDSVTVIAIRSGCQLTVYAEKFRFREEGSRVITGPNVQVVYSHMHEFQGKFENYLCICSDDESESTRHHTSASSLKLPSSNDELLEMIFSNASLANHPGLLAAKSSLHIGRSHQNAYILIIGDYEPEDSELFWKCVDCTASICECQVTLDVPELDILKAQIRVVWVYFDKQRGSDAQFVASLDQYLISHEELKDCSPNAVIVYHAALNDTIRSGIQMKLLAVKTLQGRVLDVNYSNLVFLVNHHERSGNPEAKILEFEGVIKENWDFPKPIVVLPVPMYGSNRPKVNGHAKLPSGEYYIDNVYRALLLASEKSGDALGHAIFKAAFPVTDTEWRFVRKLEMDLIPANHTHVIFHQQLASDPIGPKIYATYDATNRNRMQQISLKLEKIRIEKRFEVLRAEMTDLKEENIILNLQITDQNNSSSRQIENLNVEIKKIKALTTTTVKDIENFKVEMEDIKALTTTTVKDIENFKVEMEDIKALTTTTVKDIENFKVEMEDIKALTTTTVKDIENLNVEIKKIKALTTTTVKDIENFKVEMEDIKARMTSTVNDVEKMKIFVINQFFFFTKKLKS